MLAGAALTAAVAVTVAVVATGGEQEHRRSPAAGERPSTSASPSSPVQAPPSEPTAAAPAPRSPAPATSTPTQDVAPSPTDEPEPSPTRTPPARVVTEYYTAINEGDYRRAWDLGGSHFADSYEEFAAGFSETEHVRVEIVSVEGTSVRVRIDATETGGHRYFAGAYTVRSGVIVDGDVRAAEAWG